MTIQQPYTINRKIICEPFSPLAEKPKEVQGFAFMEHKVKMISTTVLYNYENGMERDVCINQGNLIWVDGDHSKAPWALKIYEIEGKKCIIVPYELIIMVQGS